ncbi:hypothetical protein Tco_1079157 [Tanacetum coccineum]|uniref:Eukaryotic translation initiation factor 3 subunit G N-terminal domain-containing protein n=1 Tax=Tanacetum coccineum TaxID=301880 RepID=A0ABQ5HSQ5_9ASTR
MAEYSQKWHNGTSRGRSTETSDGLAAIQAQLNNLGREIKKVNEKVYAAQVGCEQCKGPHYTKDCPLKEEGKTLEEAYYTQFGGPFQGGGYRATAPGKEDLEAYQAQLKRTRETKSSRFQPLLKLIHTRYAVLDHPNTPYPLDRTVHCCTSQDKRRFLFQVVWIIITVKKKRGTMDQNSRKLMELHISITPYLERRKTQGVSLYLALLINFGIKRLLDDLRVTVAKVCVTTASIKVPLTLGRPFLSAARAKIDVYKRKITLRVEEEKIIFKSVKPPSSLIKRVYMLSLRERIELDLEARLMGETLVLNRSLDPFLEDYIELNDLNEPYELRRNQGDLMLMAHYYIRSVSMIGFEFTHVNFFPLLYVNVMSKKFHNSIMKDKMVYKGNNVVGALMNVPIFIGTFSVVTDFAVLEDMDAYRNEGMGDVIVGGPFLREVGIKAKWFDGMITIYNGNNEVTYQMVRSHPRFKNHTNEQCNKIPPLLKVSEKDETNGISDAYQKLKGFYKEVLNLGPDYIRNTKTEKWLTRGHISVHEMEGREAEEKSNLKTSL